jgi:phosphoglycolate phosphatase-like HAD superfamily hydrolase
MGLPPLIFDMDECLLSRANGRHEPFPQVPYLIHELYEAGYPMYVASFNTRAYQVLDHLGLLPYFRAVARLVSPSSKVDIIVELAREQNFDPFTAWFFDDDPNNVRMCQSAGLQVTKVDPTIGVTESQVLAALARL